MGWSALCIYLCVLCKMSRFYVVVSLHAWDACLGMKRGRGLAFSVIIISREERLGIQHDGFQYELICLHVISREEIVGKRTEDS